MYGLRAISIGGYFKRASATENFEVSLDKMLHTRSALTKDAKKKEVISDFMKDLKTNEHYTHQEIEDGLQLYTSIINKLKETDFDTIKDEAQGIIHVMSNDETNKEEDKKISKEDLQQQYLSILDTIHRNIQNVYEILITNQSRTAAPSDEKERRSHYDILLKGYRIIGEIITNKELSATQLVGNLVLISDLNDYCAEAWKDTLEELMVTYREDVYEILDQKIAITEEKDKIKRRLNPIFFKARDKVFKDLTYGCIQKNNIDISYRPHCLDINRKYLNDVYGFNLGETSLKDDFMYKEKELHDKLVTLFKEYIKDFDIDELVVSEVVSQYSEILSGENAQKAQNEVVDWSYTYMLNNNLNKVMPRNHFLAQYVYDDTLTSVKKAAIEEILRDKGYISKKRDRDVDIHLAAKIEKALRYSEKEEELDKVKLELSKFIDKKKEEYYVFQSYKGIISSDKYNECEELLEKCIKRLLKRNMPLLRETLKKNKLDLLKLAQKSGLDIYEENENNGTCLHYACANHCGIDIIEYLLDKGFDIDYQTKGGLQYTVLMLAANMGRKDVVDFLIKRGASINIKRGDSNTALMYAIDSGNLDIVKKLVENGAKVDLVSGLEQSPPLLIAVNVGDKDIVDYLLKNNANINNTDLFGTTPLMQACINGDSEIALQLIQNNADFTKKDIAGRTALELASIGGNLHVVKVLIENGVTNEVNALTDAIKNNHLNVVEYLIDSGAYINSVNKDGLTPLMYAIKKRNIKAAQLLLNRGATVKPTQIKTINYLMKEGAGLNLLTSAIKNNDESLMEYLMQQHIKIDGLDEYKNTPLMYACANGNLDAVKYLLKNGAKIEQEGEGGVTPLIVAGEYGHLEIMEYLLKNGAIVDKATGKENKTALIYAVKKGYLDVIDFLLQHGASIDKQDKDGNTPLIIACKEGDFGIAKYLIENGANLNAQNINRETPLMFACRNRHVNIVDHLIGKGANLEIKNSNGESAIDIARIKNEQEIIDLFEQKPLKDIYVQQVINGGNLGVIDQLLKEGLKLSSIQRIYKNLDMEYVFDCIQLIYKENNDLAKSIKDSEILVKTMQSMRFESLFDMLQNNRTSESYNKIVLESLGNIEGNDFPKPVLKTIRTLMRNATENLKTLNCKDLLYWAIRTNSLSVVKTIIKCNVISKTDLEDENFSKLIDKVRNENIKQELKKYRAFVKTMDKGNAKNLNNMGKE